MKSAVFLFAGIAIGTLGTVVVNKMWAWQPMRVDTPNTVLSVAQHTDVSTDTRLINAIISVESGGDPNAEGAAGERGLCQVMRETWEDHADPNDEPWGMAFDPQTNIMVARRYLAWINTTLTSWQGHEPTVEQVLASYNGGIGRLRKCNFDVSKMPESTQVYVRKVIDAY